LKLEDIEKIDFDKLKDFTDYLDSKKIDYEKSDFWEKLLTGKKIGE
jgi:hypothetical protein